MPPSPLPAGTCFFDAVQARNGLTPATVGSATAVALSATPAQGARYYSDTSCTALISSVTIGAGQSTAGFYVKPVTGGAVTLSGVAAFGTATLNLNVLPVVRRGTCSFASPTTDGGTWGTSVACPVSPGQLDLNHTFVVFEGSSPSTQMNSIHMRCSLSSVGTLSCTRASGQGAGNVSWQTVELPTGLRVLRASGACANPLTILLPGTVNMAQSFVLKTQTDTGGFNDDDAPVVQLIAPDTVSFEFGTAPGGCNTSIYEVQVVELAGLSVSRGAYDAGVPTGAYFSTISSLPPVSAATALLTQPRLSGSTGPTCSLLPRASMPSPSSISITRGAGLAPAVCKNLPIVQVVWERLDFGSRAAVHEYTATLGPGVDQLPVAISPVDVTRALVLGSVQEISGQGVGETSFIGASDSIGEALARMDLTSATTVLLTRELSTSTAVFTFYVIELEP